MPRPLKIALIQFAPIPPSTTSASSTAQNLSKAHAFVHEAADAGAQLIVFPEYFLSGIISDPSHHSLAQVPHDHPSLSDSTVPSEEEGQHWLSSFKVLAKEREVDIVVGTIVERAEVGEGEERREVLKNVSHYVDKKGEVRGRYEKRNLWWPEKDYLTQGEEPHTVFETDYGKTGLLVCWDLAWPESVRSMVRQGLELLIVPTCWLGSDGGDLGLLHDVHCEENFLDALITTRAFENECIVVFVNCGGKKEEGWIGGSRVSVPFKGEVGKAKNNEEELLIVDVDLDILNDARTVYGIRRDLETKSMQWGKLGEGQHS